MKNTTVRMSTGILFPISKASPQNGPYRYASNANSANSSVELDLDATVVSNDLLLVDRCQECMHFSGAPIFR